MTNISVLENHSRIIERNLYFCAMQDTFKHKGMRRQLIDELRSKGITDQRILDAFDAVPRHFFLDLAFVEQAYSDIAFQIGAGQTISQPFTVAFQTQLLDVSKGDKVLEIGTGSGYQTCILCQIGAKVFTIERQKELFIKSKKFIHHFNFNPKLTFGDGYKGLPNFAPFDRILITCGAPYIPNDLVDQLKVGGKMVIPLGDGPSQRMILLTKVSEKELTQEDYGDCSFVPMLQNTAK